MHPLFYLAFGIDPVRENAGRAYCWQCWFDIQLTISAMLPSTQKSFICGPN